jgi:DNA polymerase-3 subunit gamma/tau
VTEVLYRKYRPQTFAEVVGQDAVTRTLKNSVSGKRLAHAYLFCGPRGTGKTSLGRLLAKAANCAAPVDGEPCNTCDSCRSFIEGRAIDFVEQDAASHNSVDDIRQLRENVALTPMSGDLKVYLLDEVHMLSKGAYNALLKTLEEPPPHIIFVLATTEPHKVEATIISRCQRFDLKRISGGAITGLLAHICEKEGFTFDQESLEEVARSASGSARDAINGLEQVVTYYGLAPTCEQVQEALGLTIDARSGALAGLALDGDLTGGLKLIAAVRDDGVDMRDFARQVVKYLRGLLLAKAGAAESLDLPAEIAAEVKAEARGRDRHEIVRALRAFGRVDAGFRDDPQSSLPLELAYVEFVSEPEAEPVARPQPAPAAPRVAAAREPLVTAPRAEPAPVAPAPPPEPKSEPKFSIPAAEMDEVASTVASAMPGPAAEPAPPEEAPPTEAAEPVVAASPAPAATSDGEAGLIEQVRLVCKDSDKNLAALLNGSCEVKSIEADTLIIGFYHTFHLERAESEPNAAKLRALFSRALGREMRLEFEHSPRDRTQAPARTGDLVRAAQELGARPVGGTTPAEGGQDG